MVWPVKDLASLLWLRLLLWCGFVPGLGILYAAGAAEKKKTKQNQDTGKRVLGPEAELSYIKRRE